MNEFLMIAGMSLVTFAVRYPVLALLGKIQLPDRLFRALKFVPPAVLTAIIVPAVVMPKGALDLRPANPALVGGLAAVIIAWRTKNLLLTIILSMLVFWGWRLLTGG